MQEEKHVGGKTRDVQSDRQHFRVELLNALKVPSEVGGGTTKINVDPRRASVSETLNVIQYNTHTHTHQRD